MRFPWTRGISYRPNSKLRQLEDEAKLWIASVYLLSYQPEHMCCLEAHYVSMKKPFLGDQPPLGGKETCWINRRGRTFRCKTHWTRSSYYAKGTGKKFHLHRFRRFTEEVYGRVWSDWREQRHGVFMLESQNRKKNIFKKSLWWGLGGHQKEIR